MLEAGALANAAPGHLAERITALVEENKRLSRQLQEAKVQAALGGGSSDKAEESVQVAGITLVARQVDGVDKDALRALVDRHRDRIQSGVVVLAGSADGRVLVVVGVTPDLTKKVRRARSSSSWRPIVGGGGGGRPDFAEAGGKDPARIGELLDGQPHRRRGACWLLGRLRKRPPASCRGREDAQLAHHAQLVG